MVLNGNPCRYPLSIQKFIVKALVTTFGCNQCFFYCC